MIFWQLLLAHLIGDFLLQFNEIFRLKVKSTWGVLLHCVIVGTISILFLVPYVFAMRMWCGIIILICSHFMIDWIRVIFSKKANLDNLWMFLLDQCLHISIVWLVSLIIVPPPLLTLPESIRSIIENKQIILTLCGFIAAGHFGAIFIHYLKKMFVKGYMSQSLNTKRYGIIERLLVMVLILSPGLFYLFIPPVLITRWAISRVKEKEYSLFDSLFSMAFAVIFGLILKIFVWL